MQKLVLAFVMAIALLSTVAVAQQEWTGYISDTHCGVAHMDGSKTSIDCVTTCVKGGQAPVFVTMDKKILKITDPAKVMSFLGQKVAVTGKLAGENLIIASVKAAK